MVRVRPLPLAEELLQFQMPFLGLRFDASKLDRGVRTQAVWQIAVSQFLTGMMLICFLRAMFTDPGSVPDTPEWRADEAMEGDLRRPGHGESDRPPPPVRECKQSGEPRFCKWCDMLKPDRCHHCRICRSCILRMDHHCPWIANCVGHRNHKWFFLFVLYSLAVCWFVEITMFESVAKAIGMGSVPVETDPRVRFALIFGATLAGVMCFLLTMFAALHWYLILTATTTIEYCEKRTRPANSILSYSRGVWADLEAVLGPYCLLWILPVSPPVHSGLYFDISASSRSVGEALLAEHQQACERSAQQASLQACPDDSMPPEVTPVTPGADQQGSS